MDALKQRRISKRPLQALVMPEKLYWPPIDNEDEL
jgi:hypothetical protein